MIGNIECLAKGEAINPIHVDLPNGDSNVANIQGNVCLASNINLHRVLYIPGFSCNLIFVSQLTRELNSIMIFKKDVCVI